MDVEPFFNILHKHYKNKLPLVSYKSPYTTELKMLLQKNSKLFHAKTYNEEGFVFAPFDDEMNSILMPLSDCNFHSCQFLPNESPTSKFYEGNLNITDKNAFIATVTNAVETVKEGVFEKVVLSRRQVIQSKTDFNPFLIFKRILNTYPESFNFCWYHPKVGLWIGATPETLLQLSKNKLTTMALAGTQPFQSNTPVNWQSKEKKEQQYVTSFIVKNIAPYVINLNIEDVETVRAGNLLHLKTKITANCKPNTSLSALIDALHPTPAVCGLPRLESKKYILKNENYHREFYTGFLGELNFGTLKNTKLFVTLRCLQLINNRVYIYVGGGITKDSIPLNEWLETEAKAKVMQRIIY